MIRGLIGTALTVVVIVVVLSPTSTSKNNKSPTYQAFPTMVSPRTNLPAPHLLYVTSANISYWITNT